VFLVGDAFGKPLYVSRMSTEPSMSAGLLPVRRRVSTEKSSAGSVTFLEAHHAADLVVDADTLVDRIRFGVPGDACAAGDRGGRKLRRRTVGDTVGLTVINAVESAVCPRTLKDDA
jgi:hypothetical protein